MVTLVAKNTYWTAFFFSKNISPNDLHVTHKYLGDLSAEDFIYAQQVLHAHFAVFPFKAFKSKFDIRDTFTDGDKPVTVWKTKKFNADHNFETLRDELGELREDDYDSYQPHVTSPTPTAGDLVCYALMYGDTPLQVWIDNSKLVNANTPTKYKTLRVIREDKEYQDEIEKRIRAAFRKVLYKPIMDMLGSNKEKLENASGELLKAISGGKISAYVGQQQITFRGKFTAATTKELKALGAKYKDGYFTLPSNEASNRIKQAIKTADERNTERAIKIEKKLGNILPVEITSQIKTADLFDKALQKTNSEFEESVKQVTVSAQLTDSQRLDIAKAWETNMDLWINDFAEKEIKELSKTVQQAVFSGQRYESLAKHIQDSYGVTTRKAKFLARQETNLLMAEFKKTRYVDAGVPDYIWGCVAGSPNHPVRPSHKKLEGKIFSWNNPPITDDKGSRNNPGQDYGCRCFAKPVVRF